MHRLALVLALLGTIPAASWAFPEPSIYPVSWQLDFEHGTPRRIVVQTPGRSAPVAYWYLTYTVTNNSGQERTFLPVFELLTEDGRVLRADRNVPARVFDAIAAIERQLRFLEPFPAITGELRLGEDEARDGVAIWEEPAPRMGRFSIFVAGLSGETANLRDESGALRSDASGRPILLRRTLQLNYLIRGDEVHPGEDEVNEDARAWIMR